LLTVLFVVCVVDNGLCPYSRCDAETEICDCQLTGALYCRKIKDKPQLLYLLFLLLLIPLIIVIAVFIYCMRLRRRKQRQVEEKKVKFRNIFNIHSSPWHTAYLLANQRPKYSSSFINCIYTPAFHLMLKLLYIGSSPKLVAAYLFADAFIAMFSCSLYTNNVFRLLKLKPDAELLDAVIVTF
jgi:hypothetical protein